MIAAQKKKASTPFPRAKIQRVVAAMVPEKTKFELHAADSGLRDMKVVRIVTNAWKNLQPPERIEKVLDAMEGQLSKAEEDRILRFSVLTPEEYRRVMVDDVSLPVRPAGAAAVKRLAAKRKSR